MPQSEGFVRFYTAASAGAAAHVIDTQDLSWSVATGTANSGQYQSVSISGGSFTALTVPASAKGIIIKLPAAAGNEMTLKGVTGDGNNIVLDASLSWPISLPLQQGAALGIRSIGSTRVIEVWWG